MINSNYNDDDDDLQIVNDKFVINSNDDPLAFFNLGLNKKNNQNSDESIKNNNFGGFKSNGFNGIDHTIISQNNSAMKQTDPSVNCNKNCNACVWSMFCKSATKGLSTLGGGFIPKLG